MKLPASALLIGAAFTLPVPAAAQDLSAHQHGTGQLNLVVEGDRVAIELIAPGADIVGFEHKPSSDADRAAVAAAAESLAKGGDLFAFTPGAGCSFDEAEVKSGLMAAADDDHDDHGHADHKDDDHDHADHKDGDHGHADHEDGDHGDHDGHDDDHAEFRAHYHFTCTDPDALDGLDTTYFQRFPAAQELEVQAITPAGQIARELTPAASRLTF